jgi:hypothetical protein
VLAWYLSRSPIIVNGKASRAYYSEIVKKMIHVQPSLYQLADKFSFECLSIKIGWMMKDINVAQNRLLKN